MINVYWKYVFVAFCVALFLLIVSIAWFVVMNVDSAEEAAEWNIKRGLVTIERQLELYYLENGHYPSTLEKLKGKYFEVTPRDPWGRLYEYDSDGEKYELSCCVSTRE